MKSFIAIAFIASVGLAAAETYTVSECTHPDWCPKWATVEGGNHCVTTPSYMCKCCKESCPGITCPGDASTVTTVTGASYGEGCKNGGDCASGHCVGVWPFQTCGECTENAHCSPGLNCNTNIFSGNAFTCQNGRGNGEKCGDDAECASRHCVEKFTTGDFVLQYATLGVSNLVKEKRFCRECQDDSHCSRGRQNMKSKERIHCWKNQCVGGRPNDESCGEDFDCASSHCCGIKKVLGIPTGKCRECCKNHHCPDGHKCKNESIFSWKKVCKLQKKKKKGLFGLGR